MSEASCPNFEPRAHARLTGLTTSGKARTTLIINDNVLNAYNLPFAWVVGTSGGCRLITYWPARSIFISGAGLNFEEIRDAHRPSTQEGDVELSNLLSARSLTDDIRLPSSLGEKRLSNLLSARSLLSHSIGSIEDAARDGPCAHGKEA